MKTNKGFALVALLAIIVGVLVVGGGAYLWGKKGNVKVPPNVIQSVDNTKVSIDFTLNGNTCHDRSNYFIITRADPLNAGDDILIKYKTSINQKIDCNYLVGENDFELKNACFDRPVCYHAQHFSYIKDNLLIIDEGTGPENRGLIFYDLVKRAKVFEDTYNSGESILPQNNIITYWQNTKEKVTIQNCPKMKEYQDHGGSAVIETKVSLDLSTLIKKELGESRCSYAQ